MAADGQGTAGSASAGEAEPRSAGGEIRGLADLRRFRPTAAGRLHAATHGEIRSGATTDVYFAKTMEILGSLGRADTPVLAEVFGQRPGVCCGTEEVLELLRHRPVRIEALDEGADFAAREVILRLSGPYGAFCVFETALLGMLASASAWATAARAVKRAAGDHPVTCFGSRHLHPAVAPVMERAALVGGVDGVSSVLAARLAGREPTGTLPHAVMLVVGDTVETARAYDRCMPAEERRTVLVDTFRDEAEEALRVAAALGDRLAAIRLDTPGERGGVTPDLVREVRARLDQAGYRGVGILVSGGVTAERIPGLVEAGATGFGVGSAISAAPPIDMTMDLKEVGGRPLAKRGRIPGATPSPRLRLRQPGPAAGGRGISR